MKIIDLTIQDFRGIRKRVKFDFNGKNVVILGPNGTGKSAVVDAIDFLFTGEISRLSGRGTRVISLKEHGKHIDSTMKNALVKATIVVDENKHPIQIQRRLEKPKVLTYSGEEDALSKEALRIAEKGQHVLSRAEILKYIAAEAGKRSEEIQAILNLNRIEEIRRAFVTISRDADRTRESNYATLGKSTASVRTLLGVKAFSEEQVLQKVNDSRKVLKGQPILQLKPDLLKSAITPRSSGKKSAVSKDYVKNTLAAVDTILEKDGSEVLQYETELRSTVKKLTENDEIRKDLASKRLLDLGISLIDESGACPLCLTEWKTGELDALLRNRLLSAEAAAKIEKRIKKLAGKVEAQVSIMAGHVETLVGHSTKLNLRSAVEDLVDWQNRLTNWINALGAATESYPTDTLDKDTSRFLAIEKWEEHKTALRAAADDLPLLSPEQTAWDRLTSLQTLLTRYFDDKEQYEESVAFASLTRRLSETYSNAKDSVLGNLYDNVNTEFIQYYRFLHGEDEDEFKSELVPDGSSLDFKVDFYGRGRHPPRALHSEGHQDSMGLCLYMALNKRIAEGKVNLVVLDDVVMSIDSGHRRAICKWINSCFEDLQFIITTHNRTWARQLCTDGVAVRKQLYEFRNWSVEGGPQLEEHSDVWGEIKRLVDGNRISSAAHQLREHLEFFFEQVCDALRAQIQYRTDGRYELGDYISGAKGQYKKLLRQAKQCANKWGKSEFVEEIGNIESQLNEVISRSQMEQWAINENVHYNSWADFDKKDFLPVLEAFEDFESFFTCDDCSGMLMVTQRGPIQADVKCPYGSRFWNLEKDR